MQVVSSSCCGLDIHKKFVVACFMNTGADGSVQHESRTFTTMTQEVLTLVDWLQAVGWTHSAMESTAFSGERCITCWRVCLRCWASRPPT